MTCWKTGKSLFPVFSGRSGSEGCIDTAFSSSKTHSSCMMHWRCPELVALVFNQGSILLVTSANSCCESLSDSTSFRPQAVGSSPPSGSFSVLHCFAALYFYDERHEKLSLVSFDGRTSTSVRKPWSVMLDKHMLLSAEEGNFRIGHSSLAVSQAERGKQSMQPIVSRRQLCWCSKLRLASNTDKGGLIPFR